MGKEPLYKQYGLEPASVCDLLKTSYVHQIKHATRAWCVLVEGHKPMTYVEKPEGYYHRGYILAANSLCHVRYAVLCESADITPDEIEKRLAAWVWWVQAIEITL